MACDGYRGVAHFGERLDIILLPAIGIRMLRIHVSRGVGSQAQTRWPAVGLTAKAEKATRRERGNPIILVRIASCTASYLLVGPTALPEAVATACDRQTSRDRSGHA